MLLLRWALLMLAFSAIASQFSSAQTPEKIDLTHSQDYVLHRVSSFDRSGGNADYRQIAPGQTLTVLDVDGPATLTHIWFTLSSRRIHSPEKVSTAHVLGSRNDAQR